MTGWTLADQAELDTVTFSLIRWVRDHAERCEECRRTDTTRVYCKQVDKAVQVAIDWAEYRWLVSKAGWIRMELGDYERRTPHQAPR